MKIGFNLITPCIFLISSCNVLLGVKEPKTYSDEEVSKFSSKFSLSARVIYIE